jgi:hypothetical protein
MSDVTLSLQDLADLLRGGPASASPSPSLRSCSFEVGRQYFIRTVTMHHTGRCVAITDSDIALDDAAWIADSGRFCEFLKTGVANEIEPFPGRAYVSRAAVVDFCEFTHALPRVMK